MLQRKNHVFSIVIQKGKKKVSRAYSKPLKGESLTSARSVCLLRC